MKASGLRAWSGLALLFLASCGGSGSGMSPPSSLSYPQAPIFSVDKPISPLTPSVMGTVSSYSVSPALPTGLSLSGSTGIISGTPTAVTATASHVVTASNAAGSTTVSVSIVVQPQAPVISYASPTFSFTTGVAVQDFTPTNSGGAAVSWSIVPALPAGLSFDTTIGAIGGTPTAATAPATYQVTAQNAGGSGKATLTLGVKTVLLDLGDAQNIALMRATSTRVLVLDSADNWVLWNYASGAKLASGSAKCAQANCSGSSPPRIDLAGPTLVDQNAGALEFRSSVDGSLQASITTAVSWWKLATDGSYICGGSATALTIWSPAGAVIASLAGNFSAAAVFAAPGQVQVALGPAGASVIQIVALPAGTSTVSPTFQGTFNSWFLDGARFLTNSATTIWTYSSAAVQQDLTALSTIANLTGQGNWFWTLDSLGTLNVYKVGASGSAAASYSFEAPTAMGSGTTIGVFQQGVGQASVIDLSGATPGRADYATPIAYLSAYSAVSAAEWLVGNDFGVVLDGASLAGVPRYLDYGAAWSIAGSSTRIAVATASGSILYFNAASNALEGTISFPASQLALSADGTVLAAAGTQNEDQYHSDRSIRIYSLPSATLTYTWPYTFSSQQNAVYTFPGEITLSASGTLLGQVLHTYGGMPGALACSRQLTAATGGPLLWSDTPGTCGSPSELSPAVQLSPDGTEVAVSSYNENAQPIGATNFYQNGTLIGAAPGWAIGWLDDSHVLLNNYAIVKGPTLTYTGATIYGPTGTKLASPPLPELHGLQVVTTDEVFDQYSNTIYSTTTGAALWTRAPHTGVGAISGSNVVFGAVNQVLIQPY